MNVKKLFTGFAVCRSRRRCLLALVIRSPGASKQDFGATQFARCNGPLDLPLPLGEAEVRVCDAPTNALTLTLSQRERETEHLPQGSSSSSSSPAFLPSLRL